MIERLEQAFDVHAGADGVIDVGDLQRALGLRSEYLAGRVLAGFDADGNGEISRAEFMRGVRKLVFGSEREKLEFAFRLHDGDGDGYIGKTDLLRMISLGLAESQVVTDPDEPERLAAALWKQADRNRDGRISFEEFERAVKRRPTLLASMVQSEAVWISPNEALLDRLDLRPQPRAQRARRLLANHARELLVLCLVLFGNALAFATAFRGSSLVPAEALSLRLSRGVARMLALDAGLVFVPVLRRLLTRLRASVLGRFLPIDSAIDFHRLLGHALLALGVLHGLAASIARAQGHGVGSLAGYLGTSARGLSGSLLLLVLGVMWLFALSFIRRSQRFELFYFTHLGYAAFAVLLVVHAPTSLLWAGGPLLAFGFERVVRRRARGVRVPIVKIDALRSGVTRLELERPLGFMARAGDYAFLNLPAIAPHEWHPFTISSAPERDTLVFHIRSLGNWSAALWELAEQGGQNEAATAQLDGPYGTPSADIFRARVPVLIGAGIGVTPFASVLESIMLRAQAGADALGVPAQAPEKVYFFWLNRDQVSFEWFVELLARLEAMDRRDLLEIDIRMTGGRAGATAVGLELARRAQHAGGGPDVVTGLSALTRMGHPDWDAVLPDIAAHHGPEQIEVFFCGPPGLGRKIAAVCAHHDLRFHEERF